MTLFVAGAAGQDKEAPASGTALRFVPFGAGLPGSGQWREGFRLADINGDGNLDILHGPPRKGLGSPPVIFLGDGKGSWTRWKEVRFPDLPYDYGDIEVADFNRDGHLDLALAVHLRGLLVLTGDGKGSFSQAGKGLPFDRSARSGFSSRAIRTLDWNGDGIPDLVAVWEGPRAVNPASEPQSGVVVFLNDGSKGWRQLDPPMSLGILSDSLALGDFDGDGRLDVASGSSGLGRKDLVNLWRANAPAAPVEIPIPGRNVYVQAVAAADFDNDGRDDLAVAYMRLEGELWFSGIDVFYSRPNGVWERKPLLLRPSKNVAVALAAGHLRNKDTRDLVALTMEGETLVFLGDGHGGLMRNTVDLPVYPGRCRGAHLELADLDGDGRDEIVASFAADPSGTGADSVCSTGGGITAWKALPANRQKN